LLGVTTDSLRAVLSGAAANPLLAQGAFGALVRADSAALIAALGSDPAERPSATENGLTVVRAELALLRGDTIGALVWLRRFVDTTMRANPLGSITGQARPVTGAPVVATLLPRAILLRGDLAAATGHRTEAILMYERYSRLMARSHPELRSALDRARKAAQVGRGRAP
jgi:hypothetical protein